MQYVLKLFICTIAISLEVYSQLRLNPTVTIFERQSKNKDLVYLINEQKDSIGYAKIDDDKYFFYKKSPDSALFYGTAGGNTSKNSQIIEYWVRDNL